MCLCRCISCNPTAGEDYNAVSVTYELLNAFQCWNLQTLDNDRAQSSRYFTFSFASGEGDTYTVIQPSSVTVIIADNDSKQIIHSFSV